ncbi:MAG: sugar ABC transporter ATP-binding protein [Hyphomicrobiales bacterium]|nr:sugar ABC transporter ATP-binding protein [Hyphomicrobiales bacterium]
MSFSAAEGAERAEGQAKGDLLRCVGLHKWYGSVHALKNVDFNARAGEVIGLVGDNGAGKSTLIKVLSGVHQQDRGEIYLEGQKVRIDRPRTAMQLGIETIYQYTAMIPEMSILRNIFIGRELRRSGPRGLGWLDRHRMAQEATASIANVGLDLGSPNRPVKELSGGQRQGVAIARAMHFESKILILDEPTNHLSVKETNKVLDHVKAISKKGITCIFISHNLHHVHPISDRIVAMARGEKIADIHPDDTDVDDLVKMIS